ncbi:probable 28S ribosomal protein S26, mitochondrial [Mytilus californianus]|uniref:probable 28S ribosomal protein S26, mitochondrial n=1 Tax=Mytilus californianus TaxID=6549 RepID=UPI002246F8E8|nr:probable 28S ribosomal protein S26, mitochondrial [Mytilus californianus]
MAVLKLAQTQILKLMTIKPTASILPCLNSVRYRKPRWVPKAASKEFYVREPTPIDPVEYEELKWRYQEYRNTVEAIRMHLAAEIDKKEAVEMSKQIDTEAGWERMVKLTEEWNKETAVKREKRQAEEDLIELEKQQQIEKEKEEEMMRMLTEAEQRLEFEKKQTFITMENLDEEIEKILDVRMDYEYSIDRSGNVLKGNQTVKVKPQKYVK